MHVILNDIDGGLLKKKDFQVAIFRPFYVQYLLV